MAALLPASQHGLSRAVVAHRRAHGASPLPLAPRPQHLATTLVSTKQQPSWVARAAKPADDDEEPVYYPRSASSSPSTPAAAAAEPVHVPPEPQAAATSAAAAPAAPPASSSSNSFETSVDDYKAALLDSFYGIERGLTARSEVRAEINELISSLEAKNPMPNPTEDMAMLDGTWNLVYTSNSSLIGVLALGRLPLVTVGDVTQRIDVASNTVENQVALSGLLSKTKLTAVAQFEVLSSKRLGLKLERGQIQTPELTKDLELPDTLAVLGQSVDLSQLKESLSPVKEGVQGLFDQINSLVSQGPQLSVPMKSDRAQTWQLNTFLDSTMRISRGDGGSVFVYTRA